MQQFKGLHCLSLFQDKLDKERANPEEDEKCPFSFWKWFLASYNLIEKYLQDYWKNG